MSRFSREFGTFSREDFYNRLLGDYYENSAQYYETYLYKKDEETTQFHNISRFRTMIRLPNLIFLVFHAIHGLHSQDVSTSRKS